MNILVSRKKNQIGCHQTHFVGSKYRPTKHDFAAGAPPRIALGRLTLMVLPRPSGLGGHFQAERGRGNKKREGDERRKREVIEGERGKEKTEG